jgi:tetratricopeptide (TPR) repeat protein
MRTLFPALVLVLMCADPAFAEKIGDKIVVIRDAARLMSQSEEAGNVPKGSILTIKDAKKDLFRVTYSSRDKSTKCWIKKSDVASLKSALNQINSDLRRSTTAEHYVIRGSIRLEMFAYDEAIADFTEAIRLRQDSAMAYFGRGKAWFWKSEYERALADHEEALRLDPKDARLYHSRGFVRQCNGDWQENINDYSESIRLDPKNADVYHSRGYAWHCKHDYGEAVADYTKSIELEPECSDVYGNRGGLWAFLGEYGKAIVDFTDEIRLDPKSAAAYDHRGRTWERIGDYEKALADYTEADRLDQCRVTSATTKLAFLLATCPDDKIRDGKRALDLAIDLCENSDSWNLANIHTLAAACAENGDFASAVKWEELVVEQAPKKYKAAFQFHLDLYRAGTPYRKPRPEAAAGLPQPSQNRLFQFNSLRKFWDSLCRTYGPRLTALSELGLAWVCRETACECFQLPH